MYFDIVLALLPVVNALKLYYLGVSNLEAYLIQLNTYIYTWEKSKRLQGVMDYDHVTKTLMLMTSRI